MFANTKKVLLSDGQEITCRDLTYGYVLDIDNDDESESPHGNINNATDLELEDIMELRRSDVELLNLTIIKLTYPGLFNDDGSYKVQAEEQDDDKKKV